MRKEETVRDLGNSLKNKNDQLREVVFLYTSKPWAFHKYAYNYGSKILLTGKSGKSYQKRGFIK